MKLDDKEEYKRHKSRRHKVLEYVRIFFAFYGLAL